MKVYNEDKTEILENYNLELGYLKKDFLIKHIEAVEPVEEKGHYEVLKEYPNGGKEVKWVIDVPGVLGVEAKDIEEEIKVYVPFSQEKIECIKQKKIILENKAFLKETDYVAIKIAEKKILGEDVSTLLCEYKDILEKRDKARNIINNSENIINKLSK